MTNLDININYIELENFHEARESFIKGEISKRALDEYRLALSLEI